MKGFSVFSALIGTILFIIAIVVVTLFVRTDIILKTNTLSGESSNQLEGVAGVVNAVFQATIIDVGEKTLENILTKDFPKDDSPKIFCDDPDSCYNELVYLFSNSFKDGLSKKEIAIRILNIVLGEANSGNIDSFIKCFDLELDPENNKIIVITKGKANLSIDIGGTYKRYEFSVVADDFNTPYNFSVLKNVADVVGTIFDNTPLNTKIIDAKCSCLFSCSACGCCHRNSKGKCTSHKYEPVPCIPVDHIKKEDLFFGNSFEIKKLNVNIEEELRKKGFDIYDENTMNSLKNEFDSVISQLKNIKYNIKNANCNINNNPNKICLKVGIIEKTLLGNYKMLRNKKDVITELNNIINDLEKIRDADSLTCFNGKVYDKNSKLLEYLKNNIQHFSEILNLKFCYLNRDIIDNKNNNIQNSNLQYIYQSIPTVNTGQCSEITKYYNDQYFEDDVKTYIIDNLKDIIYQQNIEVNVSSNTTTGNSYCSSSGCSCGLCYCIPKGTIERYYKITSIEIKLPVKICKIKNPLDCKIIYIKFIKK